MNNKNAEAFDAGRLALQVMPGLFVLFWSTGFIGAKYGLPYAGPFSFLFFRFVLVCLLLLSIALLTRAPWPQKPADAMHIGVVGLLIHGGYLSGVFIAISWGMSAGVVALIVGLQPLLTGLVSGPLLGEKITPRHWIGLGLGLAGFVLVVGPSAGLFGGGGVATIKSGVSIGSLLCALIALLSMTFGTIYQKRFAVSADLRTGGFIQYLAALALVLPGAWWIKGFAAEWTGDFVFALGWLVLVLSIGAISLLMLIIRHGEVSKISTLFYLVPPITALIAYFLFDEQLRPEQGIGILLCALAVWISNRKS